MNERVNEVVEMVERCWRQSEKDILWTVYNKDQCSF